MSDYLLPTAPLRLLPGKTDAKNSNRWLPAWVHMRDTAFVMKKLCQKWLPAAARRLFPAKWDMENICAFLAQVHDIGKLTPVFASNLLWSLPEISEKLNNVGCFISKNDSYPNGKETPHALAGQAILLNANIPDWMSSIVGAHHGRPVSQGRVKVKRQLRSYPKNYGSGSADVLLWEAVRQEWLSAAEKESGLPNLNYLNSMPVPSLPAQIILTGLLIMADWIASNPSYYPLISVDEDGSGIDFSDRCEIAWEKLGLSEPWQAGTLWMDWMDADTFGKRFCSDNEHRYTPNSVQQAAIECAEETTKPCLMILEAHMGAGKTEAALAAAEILASKAAAGNPAAGTGGGVFFGLPTQATANGIFSRLKDWLRNMPGRAVWSVCLAHGTAALNEEYRTMFHGTARTYEDRADPDGLLVHPWMDRPKRNLLADFVVGTVDQFLLSALQQRHLMLRHLGLCGKVVIIDEVHAYDAYMDQYLFRALQWMSAYGVPVILLSATLPARLREHLVNAYRHPFTEIDRLPQDGSETWQNSREYPQITWTNGTEVHVESIPLDMPKCAVSMMHLEDFEIADYLRHSLSGGGCAGVIVNTVQRAQTLWEELRTAFPEYHVILLHARFLAPDRTDLESEIMRRLGKQSTAAERDHVIVVGTQVLEQSLDIDFDLLLTDLCPMDLLLQRIGRLHRHTDRTRPAALQQARCAVLNAGEELERGAKAIYGDWLLERTKAMLPEIVTLPDSIPELVQAVYADPVPDPPENLVLREAWDRHKKRQQDMESRANNYRLDLPDGDFSDLLNTEKDVSDERRGEAAVRDGEPSLSVIVVVKYGETCCGFVPWRECHPSEGNGNNSDSVYEDADEEEMGFSTTQVPDEVSCLRIAREQLRLPASFSKDRVIDRAIKELKTRTNNLLKEWQQNPLPNMERNPLHGELFLILEQDEDEEKTLWTTLCNKRLRYDQHMGLVEEKEERDGEDDISSAG